MSTVDLNADVAESFGRWTLGDDQALIPHLTSANVACGFHAGDPLTIRRSCEAAARHQVSVGAQVSYRDLAGFGRRYLDVSSEDLAADVAYQTGAVDALARGAGTRVRYVKPHGALYHAVTRSPEQASAVAAGIASVDTDLVVVAFPGSELVEAARAVGLQVVTEGFADRGYGPDGRLLDRSHPGALLTRPQEAAAQALTLARSGTVQTLCVHGDSPGAPAIAAAVREALTAAGLEVRAFVT